jgi:hypothetical protein
LITCLAPSIVMQQVKLYPINIRPISPITLSFPLTRIWMKPRWITATLPPDRFGLHASDYWLIVFHICNRIDKALTARRDDRAGDLLLSIRHSLPRLMRGAKPKLFKSIASTKASNNLTKESAAIAHSRLHLNNCPNVFKRYLFHIIVSVCYEMDA